MSKPQDKRTIITEWNKGDFIGYGFSNWVNKTLYMAIIISAMIIGSVFCKDVLDNVLFILACILFAIWYILGYVKGLKFWKDNKDKDQPIKIERIHNFWSKKSQ